MTCPLIRKLYSDLSWPVYGRGWSCSRSYMYKNMKESQMSRRNRVGVWLNAPQMTQMPQMPQMRLKWLKWLKWLKCLTPSSSQPPRPRWPPTKRNSSSFSFFSVALEHKFFQRCFDGVFSLGYGWIVWLFTVSVLVTRVRISNDRFQDHSDLLVLKAV